VIADLPSLQHIHQVVTKVLLLGLLCTAALGGWLLIRFQLKARREAAIYVVAGWNLLAMVPVPNAERIQASGQDRLDRPRWPASLNTEIERVRRAVESDLIGHTRSLSESQEGRNLSIGIRQEVHEIL
jgi:hypothetical protein